MSFYRTYRPQVFDEIDNLAVRAMLLTLLSKPRKNFPHAFLFHGSRGTGKTTAARLIAKLFNCVKPAKTSGPCGKCQQCVTIAEGRNLDVLELDAASNRGIDEIRQLRDGIALSPAAAQFKVYIIDEVHMLTTEAFNALLKTLEEPPAHAVFILATTDLQKVPVTIVSRCMSLVFARATAPELVSALTRIVKKEKIPIDDEALTLIAENVDGSFRDAVKLLEQASFYKGKITKETLGSTLSLATSATVVEFLELLRSRAALRALEHIATLIAKGGDSKLFITQCLHTLERQLVELASGKTKESAWHQNDLHELIRKLSQAYIEMRGAPIAQLPLELAVAEYCGKEAENRDSKIEGQGEKLVKVNETQTSAEKPVIQPEAQAVSDGHLTLDRLTNHWSDVITYLKPYNHSVAGVMRSTRPVAVKGGIVTIEAFYTFHKDKLSETKTRETISTVLNKLFGEKVRVEVVLGKR